jgi:quercetin dioxygenase-like cupin family protein
MEREAPHGDAAPAVNSRPQENRSMNSQPASRHEGEALAVLGNTLVPKATGEVTRGAYEMFETVTPPGAGVPPHRHSREDETAYVVEGEFQVQVGDRILRATPGMLVCLPRNVPHSFRSVGAGPGKILFTISPPNLSGMFEELSRLPAATPPDMGKVTAICRKYGVEFV